MDETPTQLEPPRFEDRRPFLLAGLTERYNTAKIEGIPVQWQRFAPHIGKVPGQVGWTCYGVCFNFDGADNMDYMCAVEVSVASALPAELTELQVAEQKYAVFAHRGHISKIGGTWDAIFKQWLPTSGYRMVKAPQLEIYGEEFNSRTGTGLVEIWIPVER